MLQEKFGDLIIPRSYGMEWPPEEFLEGLFEVIGFLKPTRLSSIFTSRFMIQWQNTSKIVFIDFVFH